MRWPGWRRHGGRSVTKWIVEAAEIRSDLAVSFDAEFVVLADGFDDVDAAGFL